MNKNIHALAGFTLGVSIAYRLQSALDLSPLQYTLCVAATTLGALLPDIDTPYSYLGRRCKLISIPIYKIFGHRTITHSLFIWTLLLLFCPIFSTGLVYGLFCICLYGGVVSHLLLDTISTTGVYLLYPVYKIKFHLIPRIFSANNYRRNKHIRNRNNKYCDECGRPYEDHSKSSHAKSKRNTDNPKHKNRHKKRLPI